jgi:hypothetical protein
MPWFRSKPKRVHAEQWTDPANPPRGVRFCGDLPIVWTIQMKSVPVSIGEWIVDEGDGEHFYPIADAVFKGPKGYDPE